MADHLNKKVVSKSDLVPQPNPVSRKVDVLVGPPKEQQKHAPDGTNEKNDNLDADDENEKINMEGSNRRPITDGHNEKKIENKSDKHHNGKTNADSEVEDTSDHTNESKRKEVKKSKSLSSQKNLNDSTLAAIKRYLESGDLNDNPFENEDISAFSTRVHRYAIERTRGRQGVLFQNDTMEDGDIVDVQIGSLVVTEEDAAEERIYNQIYQKEEFHAVAKEFSKSVIEGAMKLIDSSENWSGKTANWLIRAAGMKRQYDPYEKDENQKIIPGQNKYAFSDDSDEGEVEIQSETAGKDHAAPARVTRGRIRMTRKRRQQERFEKEAEVFRILSGVSVELSKQVEPTHDTDQGRNLESDIRFESDAEMVDVKLSQTLPTLAATGLDSIVTGTGDCDADQIMRTDESETNGHSLDKAAVSPILQNLGLEYRPPGLRLQETTLFDDSEVTTNLEQTKKSKALANALSNRRARKWVRHEFFYSDLDREWYENDGFISRLIKLGMPIDADTRLTKQEWNLLRRRLRSRPRLFSKRFIAQELKKRNLHRAIVRRLQHDPKVPAFVPIPVGTTVTAHHKKTSTVAEARILLHDFKQHKYLVQFNEKSLGCEVCPDSEVAVSNPHSNQPPTLSSLYGQTVKPKPVDTELTIAKDGNKDELERDLLNSLLAVIAEAFERKKKILEALQKCAKDPQSKNAKHSPWLLSNLDRINLTLKVALTHLQVLYGTFYGSSKSDVESRKREILQMKLCTEIPKTTEFEDFMASLNRISETIATFVAQTSPSEASKPPSILRSKGIIQLLALANYLSESSLPSVTTETTYSGEMGAALKSSLDECEDFFLPPVSLCDENGLETIIEEEWKELIVAVGALRAEIALAVTGGRVF